MNSQFDTITHKCLPGRQTMESARNEAWRELEACQDKLREIIQERDEIYQSLMPNWDKHVVISREEYDRLRSLEVQYALTEEGRKAIGK